jgi:hypothetical protein
VFNIKSELISRESCTNQTYGFHQASEVAFVSFVFLRSVRFGKVYRLSVIVFLLNVHITKTMPNHLWEDMLDLEDVVAMFFRVECRLEASSTCTLEDFGRRVSVFVQNIDLTSSPSVIVNAKIVPEPTSMTISENRVYLGHLVSIMQKMILTMSLNAKYNSKKKKFRGIGLSCHSVTVQKKKKKKD